MRPTIIVDAASRISSTLLAASSDRRAGYAWELRNTARADHVGGGEYLKRIDVEGLSPSQIKERVDFSTPCILTGALSLGACEAWCDALIEGLGESEVSYQIRGNADGLSELFQSSLSEFIHDLRESNHDHSW